MANTATCPTLGGWNDSEQCLENLAGMTEVMYVFEIGDLASPLEATDNTYKIGKDSFKQGKGLKKYDLKEESQKAASEGQGKRKGFNITFTTVIDAVNKALGKESRALNNLNLGIILPDSNGEAQILYDPYKKVHATTFTSDTGAAASDDRVTTIEWQVGPVKYNALYVDLTTGDGVSSWDDLVATE